MYGVCVLLLKVADRGVTASNDVVVDGSEVSWVFLKLMHADGEKVLS